MRALKLVKNEVSQNPEIVDYSRVKNSIEARFGENLPKHFARRMSRPQPQPYCDGDTMAVKYGKRNSLFNQPYPVPCLVTPESCVRDGDTYLLGSNCAYGTDEPFPWMDHKYQCTLNFLRSLPDGARVEIQTRSDLVAHDDYIAEFKRLNVSITVLYLTANGDLLRFLEPGAPSFKRRKHAVARLKEHGIKARLQKMSCRY